MATWRRRGAGVKSSSQIEQELYERARDAANEAQRQGDAQLQAAVAAASVKPIREPHITTRRSLWSLRFGDQRLEKAYQRKSATDASPYDAIPTAGQLALCFAQTWFEFRFSQRPQCRESSTSFFYLRYMFNPLYGHMCIVAVSTVLLLFQLGRVKWYSCNRSLSLHCYVGILWFWETLKLLFTTHEIWFSGLSNVIQCVLTSFIYRVPFCMQLNLRIYALGGQILLAIVRGKVDGMHMLIKLVFIGHVVALLLAYKLDLQARNAFVQSLPRYLLDGLYGSPGEHSSYRASFSRQMWSIFYPELFEKPEGTDHASSITSESQSTPHRALGGFAGGFGGVSGLKCTQISTSTTPLPSSSNHFELKYLSDSSDDDYSSDTESLEAHVPYGLGKFPDSYGSYRGPQSTTEGRFSWESEHDASSSTKMPWYLRKSHQIN